MQNATFQRSALSPCCALYAGGMQTVKCNPALRADVHRTGALRDYIASINTDR